MLDFFRVHIVTHECEIFYDFLFLLKNENYIMYSEKLESFLCRILGI